MKKIPLLFAACAMLAGTLQAENPWIVYPGGEGPGKGRHIVLLAGDEEYRSEEGLPMMAKILSTHHGFDCTVRRCLQSWHSRTWSSYQHTRLPGQTWWIWQTCPGGEVGQSLGTSQA